MKYQYTHYDPKTGRILGHFGADNERSVALNVTKDRPAVPGLHDHRTKRVNLETLEVEDATYVADQIEARHNTLAQIEALEHSQHRALREVVDFLLMQPEIRIQLTATVIQSTERLRKIDDDIAELRKQLKE